MCVESPSFRQTPVVRITTYCCPLDGGARGVEFGTRDYRASQKRRHAGWRLYVRGAVGSISKCSFGICRPKRGNGTESKIVGNQRDVIKREAPGQFGAPSVIYCSYTQLASSGRERSSIFTKRSMGVMSRKHFSGTSRAVTQEEGYRS